MDYTELLLYLKIRLKQVVIDIKTVQVDRLIKKDRAKMYVIITCLQSILKDMNILPENQNIIIEKKVK